LRELQRGWTVKTLKSYVDRRFQDSDKAVLAALDAAQKGLDQVAVSTEKQFDRTNQKIDVMQKTLNENIGGDSTSRRFWNTAIPTLMSAAAIVVVVALRAH
jgi:hypothetical protein